MAPESCRMLAEKQSRIEGGERGSRQRAGRRWDAGGRAFNGGMYLTCDCFRELPRPAAGTSAANDPFRLDQALESKPLLFRLEGVAVFVGTELGVPQPQIQWQPARTEQTLTARLCHNFFIGSDGRPQYGVKALLKGRFRFKLLRDTR
jgi:hypothetical protein